MRIKHFFNRYGILLGWVAMLSVMLLLGGCKTVKTEYVEKNDSIYIDRIEYRDSTIFVDVPKETIKEVVPMLDTLHISSFYSDFFAWVDTATVTLKGSVQTKENAQIEANVKVPERTITKYINHYINKNVTIEKKPTFWYKAKLFIYGFLFFLLLDVIAYIYCKIKKVAIV